MTESDFACWRLLSYGKHFLWAPHLGVISQFVYNLQGVNTFSLFVQLCINQLSQFLDSFIFLKLVLWTGFFCLFVYYCSCSNSDHSQQCIWLLTKARAAPLIREAFTGSLIREALPPCTASSRAWIPFPCERLDSPFAIFSLPRLSDCPLKVTLVEFSLCSWSPRGAAGRVRPVGEVPEHHGPRRDADEEEGCCCLVQPTLLTHEIPLKHKAKITLSAQLSLCCLLTLLHSGGQTIVPWSWFDGGVESCTKLHIRQCQSPGKWKAASYKSPSYPSPTVTASLWAFHRMTES